MENVKKIQLVDLFTTNLGMNSSAESLFENINSSEMNNIELDFKNIKFMSMSFTQEYLYQKSKTDKNIYEINVSDEISKMFNLVSKMVKSS